MRAIRRAEPRDLDAVAHINVDLWRSTYRGIVPDDFLEKLDYQQAAERWERFLQRPGSIALVAEVSGEVIGYAMAGRERSGNEIYHGEVYAIYIREEHHGKGIGRQLLQTAAQHLHSAGFDSMLIWVLDLNSAARFYAACGGIPVAHQQIEIGDTMLDETAYGWGEMEMVG